MKYDVIVAGAGPAGSLCAYHLARMGHSVLIAEKAQFPRRKLCGGGVSFLATLSSSPNCNGSLKASALTGRSASLVCGAG